MAPDKLILGVISKEDQEMEIQRRLQDQEAIKARKLLASAMTHFEALKLQKSMFTEQILKIKPNGSK
jgi:hypothetical protein